jgi:hypothetical protein
LASTHSKEGQKLRDEVKAKLRDAFKITESSNVNWILGLKLERDREARRITLSQPAYVEQILQRFRMQDTKPVSIPMAPGVRLVKAGNLLSHAKRDLFQQLVGSLMWLMLATRPDLCYAVGQLCRFTSCPTIEHMQAAHQVLKYLRGTVNVGLIFGAGPSLRGYSDASWGNTDEDPRSTTGYFFWYYGPVTWASIVQRTTALSSTESEYMAVSEAGRESQHLRSVVEAIDKAVDTTPIFATSRGHEGPDKAPPMDLFCDNVGAGKLTSNPAFHRRTKHINMRYHYIRELVRDDAIKVRHLPTDQMIADVLTKPLAGPLFIRHITSMGVIRL